MERSIISNFSFSLRQLPLLFYLNVLLLLLHLPLIIIIIVIVVFIIIYYYYCLLLFTNKKITADVLGLNRTHIAVVRSR